MFVNSHTLEKYFQWMYRPLCLYALNITESYEDSEDIVQQIFVELLEKAVVGSLEVGNMKGYLYTVVRNRAVKYVKKRPRESFRGKCHVPNRREYLIHIGRGGGFSLELDRRFTY